MSDPDRGAPAPSGDPRDTLRVVGEPSDADPLAGLPFPTLSFQLVWTAAVDVAPRETLGRGPYGERFIVPIAGGRFRGGPGFETLSGEVLPGGADRQLVRPDGVRELVAIYEMRTHAGVVISIDNRVIIDESRPGPRYALSRITATAPEGPHAWLNRRLLVGTLQPLMPQRQMVVIRAFCVDA